MLESNRQQNARLRTTLMQVFQAVPVEDRPIRLLYLAERWFKRLAGGHLGVYSLTWDVPGYAQPTIPMMALTEASYHAIAELWDAQFARPAVRAFREFSGVPEFIVRGQHNCHLGWCDLLGTPKMVTAPAISALEPSDPQQALAEQALAEQRKVRRHDK